jgi:hypothetical protein
MHLKHAVSACAAAGLLFCLSAQAADPFGFHVGGGVVRATMKGTTPEERSGSTVYQPEGHFEANDTSWKALVGIRPVPWLGAELQYADLGSSSEGRVRPVHLEQRAIGAFALLYAPIPLPAVELYAKAGYARMDGRLSSPVVPGIACLAVVPNVWPCWSGIDRDLDGDALAAGAGAQLTLGSWAIRGEYERYSLSGPDPRSWSLTLMKQLF